MTDINELKDEELEKVNGGADPKEIMEKANNTPCEIFVEIDDDVYAWRAATYVADYTGGTFVHVMYKGVLTTVSTGNIRF